MRPLMGQSITILVLGLLLILVGAVVRPKPAIAVEESVEAVE